MGEAKAAKSSRRGKLDARLADYARSADGVLRAARGAARKLAPTTAAAGAALVMAPAADAGLVYSGIQNISLTHPGTNSSLSVLGIDLDGVGGADVRLGVDRDSSGSSYFYQPYLTALTSVQGIRASFGSVVNLTFGATIGSSGIQAGYAYPYLYSFTGTTGYAGVRFNVGGQPHFAWLRISVSSDGGSITVIDWAWEDQPNTPVNAGFLPAPEPPPAALTSLGLLALGAAGVRHRRRRLAELSSRR
jgi:hypothetical protein